MAGRDILYSMPLGYGPASGPSQSAPSGERHPGWEHVRTTSATIIFKAPRAILATFLPHTCFEIATSDPPTDEAFASINFTRLENLPWLAGRGYNHCGFYIHDVVCRGRDEQRRGKYLSVLFENRADPITTGREQLGYAKVFATLDEEWSGDQFVVRMGWDGAVFGTMALRGLREAPPEDGGDVVQDSLAPSEGLLHFKYVPRTGGKGCDAMYPTFTPLPPADSAVVQRVLRVESAELEFTDLGFESLPTLHHVGERLASLPVANVVDARVVESVGATDISEQKAIALGDGRLVL